MTTPRQIFMEDQYLTIKQAMVYTGKSEETVRRFIRSVRERNGVELDDTNEQIKPKTQILRKQNEDFDRREEPIWAWLILQSVLEEAFPDYYYEGTHSPTQSLLQNSLEDAQSRDEDEHADGQEEQEYPQKGSPSENENTRLEDEESNEDTQPSNDDSHKDSDGGTHLEGDHPQEPTITMPKTTYDALLGELGTKNKQVDALQILVGQAQDKLPNQSKPMIVGSYYSQS